MCFGFGGSAQSGTLLDKEILEGFLCASMGALEHWMGLRMTLLGGTRTSDIGGKIDLNDILKTLVD